jgi:uncharacterized membrane protein
MELETSIHIEAAAADVWTTMTDVGSYPRWTSTMTKVERLDAGPLAIGSRVRITQPKLGTNVWTVTAIEPGRSFVWEIARPGIRTVATHTIVPDGTGVRLTLGISQRGAIGRLVARVLAGLTQRYIETEAAGCKRWTETARTERSA